MDENELAELLAGLDEDHKYVCDTLADGDYNAETNSGSARDLIISLVDDARTQALRITELEDELEKLKTEVYELQEEADARDIRKEEERVRADAIVDYLHSRGIGMMEWIADPTLRALRDAA